MSDDYQTLERELLGIMTEVHESLGSEAIGEVQMYLDAGEYGLALETICAALKQTQTPVSAATYVALSDVGQRLDVEPSYWLDLEVT